ncbi:tRNA 2-thiouridine(34) synthase MnmA [Chloroflexota bacterium]
MSGGVDSSIAAALLKELGYSVIGVTMKTWGGETFPVGGKHHGCYGPGEEEDVEDARKVARILNIPFLVFDLRQEFKNEVLDYLRNIYMSGQTPNPCVRCNSRIKFDALEKKVKDSGIPFDYFASGHYARVEYDESKSRHLLKKARDLQKDQSYFLFSLSQEQLSHSLFPLGNLTKDEVRRMAFSLGLDVVHKPESQDFADGRHLAFFTDPVHPGPIINRDGKVLGQHNGIQYYTIGQRKGLGIAARKPLYVIAIDETLNNITVGSKNEVYGDELIASEVNWISVNSLKQTKKAIVKIRNLHIGAEAIITPLDNMKVHIKFKEPQMAIAPGQAAVFYEGDSVLGGGTIKKAG